MKKDVLRNIIATARPEEEALKARRTPRALIEKNLGRLVDKPFRALGRRERTALMKLYRKQTRRSRSAMSAGEQIEKLLSVDSSQLSHAQKAQLDGIFAVMSITKQTLQKH